MDSADVLERFLDLLEEAGAGLSPEAHAGLARLMRHQLKDGPFSHRQIPRILGAAWSTAWPQIRGRYPVRKSDGLLSFQQINRWRDNVGGTAAERQHARTVFAEWWTELPPEMRKGGKAKAGRRFVRMFCAGELPADPVAEIRRRKTVDAMWAKGIGIPYADRYLRDRLFGDEVVVGRQSVSTQADAGVFDAMRGGASVH